MSMICVIDLPRQEETCERMSVRTRGWLILPVERRPVFSAVVVRVAGRTVARSSTLLRRTDVAAAHGLPADTRTGFDFFFDLGAESPGATTTFEVWVEFTDGTEMMASSRTVHLSTADYTRGHFVPLLQAGETDILHRKHIYTAGPSAPEPSTECLGMILERIDPGAGNRLLDVGCGVGAYAHPLQAAGFAWTGLEVSEEDCAALERAGLPHRRGDGRILPFPDRSFDVALCVEVLEHVEDVDSMLSEIRRVAGQAFFSVPNCELIPYFSRHLVVPWHVLESTHVNFFSRWTLRALLARHFRSVEIGAYGPAPVRSVEGAPLYYHLFAHVRS